MLNTSKMMLYATTATTTTTTRPPPPDEEGPDYPVVDPFDHVFNEINFTLNPGESVVIMFNCANHWLGSGAMYEIQYQNNQFYMPPSLNNNPEGRFCVWIQNITQRSALFVPENTSLTALIYQPEIIYRCCFLSANEVLDAITAYYSHPPLPTTPDIESLQLVEEGEIEDDLFDNIRIITP